MEDWAKKREERRKRPPLAQREARKKSSIQRGRRWYGWPKIKSAKGSHSGKSFLLQKVCRGEETTIGKKRGKNHKKAGRFGRNRRKKFWECRESSVRGGSKKGADSEKEGRTVSGGGGKPPLARGTFFRGERRHLPARTE